MPVHHHRARATTVLAVAMLALVSVALAPPLEPAGAKPKSRSKIIDLSPPSKYLLTISGNFETRAGDAVEKGTIEVPFIVVNILQVGKLRLAIGEPANGAVVESVVVQPTCQSSGLVVFNMTVLPLTSGAAAPDDSDLSALAKNAPAGKVGFRVAGAFLQDEKNNYRCKILDPDGRTVNDETRTLAGGPASAAFGAAGELIFPVGGGTLPLQSKTANPSWKLRFVLKKA